MGQGWSDGSGGAMGLLDCYAVIHADVAREGGQGSRSKVSNPEACPKHSCCVYLLRPSMLACWTLTKLGILQTLVYRRWPFNLAHHSCVPVLRNIAWHYCIHCHLTESCADPLAGLDWASVFVSV